MTKSKLALMVSAAVIAGAVYAGEARAADMYMPQAGADWNGIYVGGHVGGAIGEAFFDSDTITQSDAGALAGLQAGVDFDQGNFVWGIVADISFTDVEIEEYPNSSDHVWKPEILASVRGRIGMKFGADQSTLLYGTGGIGIINGQLTSSSASQTSRETVYAPVVGIGVEHKVGPGWSVFAEGLAYLADDWLDDSETKVETMGVMRLGVNMRF